VIAINVKNLGKKFKLFTSPGRRFLEYISMGKVIGHSDFWALKDITFEIPKGTTLGILGQNGSGKSTLLSILAGVLYPSAGSFEIQGKVSAILELGSGFHPEFSGRDNVYMYGSIMGLSKPEIDTRFDEIVKFSELEDFIDQPLRTYSSGMVVRLAFSVAVNVDADILIVDEALAVGDAIFQHRCFRKIRQMQSEGKTILYVGHDTEAVRNLCTQALLLDGGRIVERGDPNYVVNKYYALIAEREQAYSEGNLTEHGEIPDEGYETVYSFVQNLKTAKIISPPTIPASEQTIEINSTPRKVIFAHPPSEITYSVLIPPGSSLSFAIGIMPGAWNKIPQGVKFDIEILSESIRENVFSRVLQPKRNIGDRGWHNFIVPLEPFWGLMVSIIFRTSGSGDDLSYGWSAWGWLNLVQQQDNPEKETISVQEDTGTKNSIPTRNVRYGNKKVQILNVHLLNETGEETRLFPSGDPATIKIQILLDQDIETPITVGFMIKNRFCDVCGTNTHWKDCDLVNKRKGDKPVVEFRLKLLLAPGVYSLTSGCSIFHSDTDVEFLDRWVDCIMFKISSNKRIGGIFDSDITIQILDEKSG
jgi:ABC-type polysaccharide/polyol phosphate transport system ATPase subunit